MLYLTHLFLLILFFVSHPRADRLSRFWMASSTQDWSDEDEDDTSQIETSIHLGVPDGPVESASDLNDATVSRIGGLWFDAMLNQTIV